MKKTNVLFLLFYITAENFVAAKKNPKKQRVYNSTFSFRNRFSAYSDLSKIILEPNRKPLIKPNVIILLSDDVGIGDLEVYNSKSKMKTPNLNKMARNGFRFLDAHSASSKCSPSRYMLLTGRYSLNSGSSHPPINFDQPSLGTFFRKAGYHTGIIGKSQPYDATYEPGD